MFLNDALPHTLLDVLCDAEIRCLIDDLSREPIALASELDD